MQYALVPAGVELIVGDKDTIEKASAGVSDFRVFVVRELPVTKPAAPKIKFPVPRVRKEGGKPGRPKKEEQATA